MFSCQNLNKLMITISHKYIQAKDNIIGIKKSEKLLKIFANLNSRFLKR